MSSPTVSARSIAIGSIIGAAVAVLSFLPGVDKRALHTRGSLHSIGHLLSFTVIAYFAARSSSARGLRIVLFIGCVILGLGIECGQDLLFHRGLEWNDVLLDCVGVIAGTLIEEIRVRRMTRMSRTI